MIMRIQLKFSKQKLYQNSLTAIPEKRNRACFILNNMGFNSMCLKGSKYKLSHFSCVQFCSTLWTAGHQVPLSMGFSGQEYWSGLPCSPPRNLPDPGIKPVSIMSPASAGRFFISSVTWEA